MFERRDAATMTSRAILLHDTNSTDAAQYSCVAWSNRLLKEQCTKPFKLLKLAILLCSASNRPHRVQHATPTRFEMLDLLCGTSKMLRIFGYKDSTAAPIFQLGIDVLRSMFTMILAFAGGSLELFSPAGWSCAILLCCQPRSARRAYICNDFVMPILSSQMQQLFRQINITALTQV